jgi:hypothetical protein
MAIIEDHAVLNTLSGSARRFCRRKLPLIHKYYRLRLLLLAIE